jgi:ribose transport system permease protein
MFPVLAILCVVFHILSEGRFFSTQNISIVLQQASVNTVLAAGMTFVILTGGSTFLSAPFSRQAPWGR